MYSRDDIQAFLAFGYNPWDQEQNIFIQGSNYSLTNELSNLPLSELKSRLTFLLLRRTETILKGSNHNFVVPLSGGLDSRAFLSLILKYVPAEKVKTYTYGTKGTLDFEIGNQLAKKVGTKHLSLPITANSYNKDHMEIANKFIHGKNLLFLHPPMIEALEFIGSGVVLSGAMIDVMFGRHKYCTEQNSFKSNIEDFIEANSIDDTDFMYRYKLECSRKSENDFVLIPSNHGYGQSLDLSLRQANIIYKQQTYDSVRTEYMFDEKISSFALSLPTKMIKNQRLYRETLFDINKKLMSLPMKTEGLSGGYIKPNIYNHIRYKSRRVLGKLFESLSGVDLRTNYLNWSDMIDRNSYVQSLFKEGMDLISDYEILEKKEFNKFMDQISKSKSLQYLAVASLPLRVNKKN